MSNLTITDYPWHQGSWAKFVNARSQNHLPHALLISGMEGTGKLDFARKIVTSLLCTSPVDNTSCQKCQSCKTYQAGANPDYMQIELLEGKQQISVDQIRQLSKFISYTRSFNAYRVILLNPVERMNLNAANSLLKSLEEPASNTLIVLVATNLGKILPTIKSRCQLLTLPSPNKNQSVQWVRQRLPKSNPEELLDMANMQPLNAIKVTDEDIQNREALATDLLGICTHQKMITEVAKSWEKFDHSILINWQTNWLIKIIKSKVIDGSTVSGSRQNLGITLSNIKNCLAPDSQWILYHQLIKQKQYIHTSVNSLLFIENLLLLWLQASRSK